MPTEWSPGEIGRILNRVEAHGMAAAQRALTETAQAMEAAAKANANGRPGPNVVSGNLRRSITHTPAQRSGDGVVARMGVAVTAAYGKWVEPRFPFVLPAARSVARAVPGIWQRVFVGSWR